MVAKSLQHLDEVATVDPHLEKPVGRRCDVEFAGRREELSQLDR
jgi:hypothetical protein